MVRKIALSQLSGALFRETAFTDRFWLTGRASSSVLSAAVPSGCSWDGESVALLDSPGAFVSGSTEVPLSPVDEEVLLSAVLSEDPALTSVVAEVSWGGPWAGVDVDVDSDALFKAEATPAAATPAVAATPAPRIA
ncbi:hypothetical protein N7492_001880 [Penicillium capsulatum]|uniref:Uncharacterized protein n=1 Tax=Penicillium capsulatum TaxID=69766 RepID=A0A9W9IUH8_9EURO|nr:hypothetical protein N7492_001880 [Penicillium capsulatum]KAJ6129072.1 hypothetical protein N7512_001852 [Penicillium capsulatum]